MWMDYILFRSDIIHSESNPCFLSVQALPNMVINTKWNEQSEVQLLITTYAHLWSSKPLYITSYKTTKG